MKVTHVSLCQTDAAKAAGRVALTPELLAATGARYSRNNEGLDAIVAKIDPNRLDASVDSIFRMLDYGHQSIADMVPVAIFMDDISIWLAYHIWSLAPQAGGQESSTRYIRISPESLLDCDTIGIPEEFRNEWADAMSEAFEEYSTLEAAWDKLSAERPQFLHIPAELLADETPAVQRQVARMKRNYAFDRARYLLPSAARTNVMMTMSARAWALLARHLCSDLLPEARALGEAIRGELQLVAPHLLKHSGATADCESGIRDAFNERVARAKAGVPSTLTPEAFGPMAPLPHLEVMAPDGLGDAEFAEALKYHSNRYAWQGSPLTRTAVRFGWDAVALAEIRDLNRHRTGSKYSSLVPQGFYCAEDQMPLDEVLPEVAKAAAFGRKLTRRAYDLLAAGDPTYVYWTLLGTQFDFEHVTTADKFIYESELRTGTGSHFRYARHLADTLAIWYRRYPSTKGLVIEGSAEPE